MDKEMMMKKTRGRVVGAVAAAILGLALLQSEVRAGAEDWNDAKIKWLNYEDGLAAAKNEKRPVCLVFYTSWCPHCANYSKVFQDQGVVDKSKSFVMIRVDGDKRRDLSEQYKPDGAYIPRTFFLSPDGKLDESLTAGRPQYKYFYDEASPAGILAGMDNALKRFAKQ
jgi:thiol:disulfide interchange protein